MSAPTKTKRPRGTSKKGGTLIGSYVHEPMLKAIDSAVQRLDIDRSKFMRAALREKLEREGFAA